MKHAIVSIPLSTYLEIGGTLNKNDILYYKGVCRDVKFVEFTLNEHNDKLVVWKWLDEDEHFDHLHITINDFNINVDIVLKNVVTDVAIRAYNMGGYSGNAMARAIHKVKYLSIDDFLTEEELDL